MHGPQHLFDPLPLPKSSAPKSSPHASMHPYASVSASVSPYASAPESESAGHILRTFPLGLVISPLVLKQRYLSVCALAASVSADIQQFLLCPTRAPHRAAFVDYLSSGPTGPTSPPSPASPTSPPLPT